MSNKSKRCILPGCNNKARIKFCSNRHKDRYHNLNNPRGMYAHLSQSDAIEALGEDYLLDAGDR